MEEEAKKEKE